MAENRAIKRFLKTLELIETQTTNFNDDTSISEIKASLTILADEWKEFQTLERTLKGKFDDANMESVEKIESYHFELKQTLLILEKSHDEIHNNQHANCTMDEFMLNQTNFLHEISNLTKRESEVCLPRVNIPVFSGQYSEFISFRDLFEASIHNNQNIRKVHKLQYLKGLLKGEAYSLINHLTVTDANNDEAWDKVKAKYDKRKQVVRTLIKQFLDQPSLNQNCSKSISSLSDVSDEILWGLKVLGEQAQGRDPWLIYILVSKLDNDLKEAWSHETAEIDFPTLNQLFRFLNKRSDALECISTIKITKPTTSRKVNSLASQSSTIMCPLCSGDHHLGRCEKFIELPVPECKQFAVTHKLCFNCLSSTHQSTVCRSRYNCKICRRRHHLTLHPEAATDTSKESSSGSLHKSTEPDTSSLNAIVTPRTPLVQKSQAILPTAIVVVKDKSGKLHRCRALLDSGSQTSFVSENCIQRLQLHRRTANVNITGIPAGSLISRGKAVIMVGSVYNPNVQIEVDALIINKLPSKIPCCDFDSGVMHLFEDLQLADPDLDRSAPIDILIGADKFFSILDNGKKQFESTILYKTIFGWVVSGHPNSVPNANISTFTTLNVLLDIDVDTTLRQFWELEETPKVNIMSPEDVK